MTLSPALADISTKFFSSLLFKANFHYAIQLANRLAIWSATC